MTDPILAPEPLVDAPSGAPAVADALQEEVHAKANAEFLAMLPEELRDVPALKSVKDASDLATQFINQQGLIGNSLRIPSEDTSAEQKQAFYDKLTSVPGVVRIPDESADDGVKKEFQQKLGVPSTPDEYKVVAPEGTTLEADYLQGLTKRAHELGLNNEQVNKIVAEDIAANKASQEQYEDYVNKSRTALKSIWAQDYDTRVAGATNAMRVYAQEMPEFAQELQSVADNPLFVKMLSDLGASLQEQGHAGMQAANNYGMSVAEAEQKISEIMSNPQHPYFQGDAETVARVLKYHEIVAGGSA